MCWSADGLVVTDRDRAAALARRLIAHRGLDGATWAVQRRCRRARGRVRRFLMAVQAHIDLNTIAAKGNGLDTATRYWLAREPSLRPLKRKKPPAA